VPHALRTCQTSPPKGCLYRALPGDSSRGKDPLNLGFATAGDLLRAEPTDVTALPAARVREQMLRFDRAILLSNLAIQRDRAWKTGGEPASSSD